MTKRCKVMFISAPIGSGHVMAAQAIGAAVRRADPNIATDFVNVFDLFHPLLGSTILKTYLKVLDLFPQLYGMMYGWGNTSSLATAGREIISGYLAGRMHEYLKATNPAAVVCTHATPAGLVAYLCRKANLAIPVFAVVTDFVVHRLWVYPEIGQYVVAGDSLRDYLAGQGIGYERSRAFGIPVDAKFALPHDRTAIFTALGLSPDMPTILVMGGGAGVLPMTDIIAACDNIGLPLQIIAVTGNNAGLRLRLEALQSDLTQSTTLRVLGFVDNVDELMAVSDLLISKPGGMTAAEALCMGLPMIIYRPIPGQEEGNTRYLVDHSAACCVQSIAELRSTVTELLTSGQQKLAGMRQQALVLGRPSAAEDIAAVILQAVHNS